MVDSGDISIDEMADTLEGLEHDFNTKVESTALVIKEYSAKAVAIKTQIDALSDLKRVADNNVERLKNYLREEMEKAGIAKVDGTLAKVTLGKPSEVVSITGEVPEEYQKVTVSEDKTKIKAALKAGESVTGAVLTEGKAKILIK